MSTPHTPSPRPDAATELRETALRLFVEIGYAGASLQMIADAAGYSKSSVLYHFPSKEALLEACLASTIDQLEAMTDHTVDRLSAPDQRGQFVDEFVDFLLAHRREAHIVINQGQTLVDVPVIHRAIESMERLSDALSSGLQSTEQQLRVGIALGGAAFVLVANPAQSDLEKDPAMLAEVRAALVAIVSELITPLAKDR